MSKKSATVTLSFFDNDGFAEVEEVPAKVWENAVLSGKTEDGYLEFTVKTLQEKNIPFVFENELVKREVERPLPKVKKTEKERFSKTWWKEEVKSGETRRSYLKWVEARQDELDHEVTIISEDGQFDDFDDMSDVISSIRGAGPRF